jgi:hypothetical protein
MDERGSGGPNASAVEGGPQRAAARGRRSAGLVAVVLVAVVGVAALAASISTPPAPSPAPASASAGTTPGATSSGAAIGDVASLAGGAVARLNGLETGVAPLPGSPGPEPGMRLDRVDVEVCAGTDDLFTDAAFWNGLGRDRRVHSAHLGVRTFYTLTLAPGSCQRGGVELAVPEAVELEAILLLDLELTTAARWAAAGQAVDAAPLTSAVDPTEVGVGSAVELGVGGSATVHAVELDVVPSALSEIPIGGSLVRVDAELCAGGDGLPASPRHWFIGLADQRLIPGDPDGWAAGAGSLAARACDRGVLEFAVPAGARPIGVRYAYGGQFEQARWGLGG